MQLPKIKHLVFLIIAIVVISIGILTAMDEIAETEAKKPYPYKRLLVGDGDGRVQAVDVIVDVQELIKQHGDDSKLLRTIDEDANVVIYFTLNATGDMVTSMHPIPFADLDVHSDLFKRYKPW